MLIVCNHYDAWYSVGFVERIGENNLNRFSEGITEVRSIGDLQLPSHQLHDICMRQWCRCSLGILKILFLVIT